jgi:MFS family permease
VTESLPEPSDRSYRALLAVPRLGRTLLAMQIARVAQSMVGLALVLFTLLEYRSPILAGAVTFLSIVPGLLVSPIAGALLDRHGRVRLITLDYLVALAALVLLGVLALAKLLPPALLLLIAAVSSLTSILSQTGLRSLFPLLVPEHLWERVNAIDSNGYVVATLLGPPTAGSLVAVFGGPTALIAVGLSFGLAAIAMIGVPDPQNETASTGSLLRDAWQGLVYTWRNPTLRGLGFAISTLNIAGGIGYIAVPLIVLDRLGLGEVFVGGVFAVSGITGMVSALLFGRFDSRGREWRMLVWPMVALAPGTALLLAGAVSVPVGLGVAAGLGLTAASLALAGLLSGPLDIALFTVRQRRTEQAWMGRAFAVSMAFNFIGYPIGAALGGIVAEVSLEAAIVIAIAACVLGAVLAATMIPKREDAA